MSEYDARDDGAKSYDVAISAMREKRGLVAYEAACLAVAEAKTTDEAKNLHDTADAMRVYARQAKNRQMEVDAAEIRMRAERRLGEIIKAQKETVGLNKGRAGMGRPAIGGANEEPPKDAPPTLAEAGIDKKMSSRAQKLAAVPEDKFEGMLGEWRDRVEKENERVTVNLLREGEKAQQDKAHADLPIVSMPEGKYGTIVIDPPWPMERVARDVRPNQVGFDYPTMELDEISQVGVSDLADDDCHLFCWTTQKFLPATLGIIEGWGFKYVLTFVWHKSGGFQPFGLPQYNCEFAVYGRRGSPKFIDTKKFPTCFNGGRREHSRKPDEFYDVVKRVTGGKRIDMFSREARDGFALWGNQTAHFEGAL